jgi:hypothetical protein
VTMFITPIRCEPSKPPTSPVFLMPWRNKQRGSLARLW